MEGDAVDAEDNDEFDEVMNADSEDTGAGFGDCVGNDDNACEIILPDPVNPIPPDNGLLCVENEANDDKEPALANEDNEVDFAVNPAPANVLVPLFCKSPNEVDDSKDEVVVAELLASEDNCDNSEQNREREVEGVLVG